MPNWRSLHDLCQDAPVTVLPLTGVQRPQSLYAQREGLAALRLVVYGDPVPQGSKRPFVTKAGKVNLVESSKSLPSWRAAIIEQALMVMRSLPAGGEQFPLPSPIHARLTFTRSKPSTAPKRKRSFPTQKPDLDKLIRAVFDPLVAVGVISDDSRIVAIQAEKFYPGERSAFEWAELPECTSRAGGLCINRQCGCFWLGLPVPGLVAELQSPLTLDFFKRRNG